MSAVFDEAKHPREPSGNVGGGRWTSFTHSSPVEMKARGVTKVEAQLNNLHYDKVKKKWVMADGTPVSAANQQRLTEAKAKPGYSNVSLNPDIMGELQARGLDAKGRTQYMYTSQHSEVASAEKFARVDEFNSKIVGIRSSINGEFKNGKNVGDRDSAAVLKLIDQTGIRIGSDQETGGSKKIYGATTLMGQHVDLRGPGNTIKLSFLGKSGQMNERTVHDARLKTYLKDKNLSANDRVFATSDSRVRDTMKRVTGEPDFSPKDFRTRIGTAIALREIANHPTPTSLKEQHDIRLAVGKAVSSYLNNTPSVALKSYVDPAVFRNWGP